MISEFFTVFSIMKGRWDSSLSYTFTDTVPS